MIVIAEIPRYGAMILCGFLAALVYCMIATSWQVEQMGYRRITPSEVFAAGWNGLFLGIVGTRILYVLLNWGYYQSHLAEVLAMWNGGLTFLGAPLAGFTFLWLYCRHRNLSFWSFADICAPGFALAYAFGRIGCYFAGCCYGHPANLPWAVRFPDLQHPGEWTPPSHPTQLYSSLSGLCIFAILFYLSRRPHPVGAILAAYAALYCVYRFANEFFRAGATATVCLAGLTLAQLFCIFALSALAGWLLVSRHREKFMPLNSNSCAKGA